jgi:hypothetical protein
MPRFGKNVRVIGKPALKVAYTPLFKEYPGIKNIAFISICAHVNADALYRKITKLKLPKIRLFFAVQKCCNRLLQSLATESFVIPKKYYANRVKQLRKQTLFVPRGKIKDYRKCVGSRYITEYYYPPELKKTLALSKRPVARRVGKLVHTREIAY